jgi:hypothetical protein
MNIGRMGYGCGMPADPSFGARYSSKAIKIMKDLKPTSDDAVAAGSGAAVAASPSLLASPAGVILTPIGSGSIAASTAAHPTVSGLAITGAGVALNRMLDDKPSTPKD